MNRRTTGFNILIFLREETAMRNRHNGKHSTNSTVSEITYIIHFDLRCTNQSGEFLPTTKSQNELTIRDMTTKALHPLFKQVQVDRVSVQWILKPHTFPCFQISVNAHCSQQTFSDTGIETIEGTIESKVTTVFAELFTSTHVDEFVVRSLPTKEWSYILSL